MKLEKITEGLKRLLIENHYSIKTIIFYEREWDRIHTFLMEKYGSTEFEISKGLEYLEQRYGFISNYKENALTQQRVQLLRVVHMLEDYKLHKVLTKRYYASKNPLALNSNYKDIHRRFSIYLDKSELSASTKKHYMTTVKVFLDYLTQISVLQINQITMETCNMFVKTLAGYSFKTIEQIICGLRYF